MHTSHKPMLLQAPALPNSQIISSYDRVYTADQDSNTVTVIDPKSNVVMGTIPFGNIRMDTNADMLGAMYAKEIDVHGLGFSRDGRHLVVVCVTTNSVHVIETATNRIIRTVYVNRAPHEAFFTPDGHYIWVAERGANTLAIIDWRQGRIVGRIETEDGPSKVVFSPDGRTAYVNHLRASMLDVIDVNGRRVVQRVGIPEGAGGSSDEAISPDGREVWLGMPVNGRTTTVFNTNTSRVEAVMDTGPRTNHPNFVTVDGVNYAYLSVGDLNQTLVFRREMNGKPPTLVKAIRNSGAGPHGIWPSVDNSRIYVALQYSDAVDVIDTKSMTVIDTMRVGQSPMALVYVARSEPAGALHLSRQGLDRRIELFPIKVQGSMGAGTAQVRSMPGIDEVTIDVRGLPANRDFTVYAMRGQEATALLTATSSAAGAIPETLAFVHFFLNRCDRIVAYPATH